VYKILGVLMKKTILFLLLSPVFLFSGVFEHLLNKDQNYLFEHNFRCHSSTCITSEKNIFDNSIMDDSVKVVKTFLDNKKMVFKIEIELAYHDEKKDAFYNAVLKSAEDKKTIKYNLYDKNDKYGNHSFVNIVDKKREEEYIKFLSDKYYQVMKSYKN
jgi:hypothetical protein